MFIKFNKVQVCISVILGIFVLFVFSTNAEVFLTDSENLKSELEQRGLDDFTRAYHEKVKIFDAWNEIRSSNAILSHVDIGIIDSGVDVRNPEFSIDMFSDRIFLTPQLLRDRSVKQGGHGTKVAGVIGANNITSAPGYEFPYMNGIIAGVYNDYTFNLADMRSATPMPQWLRFFNFLPFLTTKFSSSLNAMPKDAVVNMSIGLTKCSAVNNEGGCIKDDDFDDFKDYYLEGINKRSDVLFVISAGNGNEKGIGIDAGQTLPAGIDAVNIITVAAVHSGDGRISFSNHTSVDISAPGGFVYAPTRINEGDADLGGIDEEINYTTNFSGTSAAAPFVTGVAGLLKAINSNLTPVQIKNILIETADPIQTGETNKRLGTGCYLDSNDPLNTGCRLNAHSAVCHPDVGLNCQPETGGESPWPQFQHDSRHTGQSEFQGPQTNNIKWRFEGSFFETPAVGPDETIYIGAKDLSSQRRFFALNPDGSVKWKSIPLNAIPTSPAVITDNVVLVVAGALDFGSQIFAFEDSSSNTEKQPLWSHSMGGRVEFVTKAPDNTLYITTDDGFLFSLTPSETGVTENWRVTVANNLSPLRSSPAIGLDGKIYVTDLKTVFHTPKLIAVNPNGTIAWTQKISDDSNPSALVLDDGTIVVAESSRLRGFNPDGTEKFRTVAINSATQTVPALLPNGNIAVGARDNNNNSFLVKIDPGAEAGEEIQSITAIGSYESLSAPVIDSEGTVYIAGRNYQANLSADLFAFNPDNSLKFSKNFSYFLSHPAIGSQNSLYIPVIETAALDFGYFLVRMGE